MSVTLASLDRGRTDAKSVVDPARSAPSSESACGKWRPSPCDELILTPDRTSISISLFLRRLSLFDPRHFPVAREPVPCFREQGSLGQLTDANRKIAVFRPTHAENQPCSLFFPCRSARHGRDGFAPDCAHHHSYCRFPSLRGRGRNRRDIPAGWPGERGGGLVERPAWGAVLATIRPIVSVGRFRPPEVCREMQWVSAGERSSFRRRASAAA
jgi:hypothetical protein